MGAININKSTIIDASPDRVWQLLADDFTEVERWASGVNSSGDNPKAGAAPAGAVAGGRACDLPGFGLTDERFTRFDDTNRSYAYSVAADKVPGFVENLQNAWKVDAAAGGKSKVTSTISANATGPLGAVMGPMMKRQFSKSIGVVLDDLKIYLETGNVSPAKKKALAKLAAKR